MNRTSSGGRTAVSPNRLEQTPAKAPSAPHNCARSGIDKTTATATKIIPTLRKTITQNRMGGDMYPDGTELEQHPERDSAEGYIPSKIRKRPGISKKKGTKERTLPPSKASTSAAAAKKVAVESAKKEGLLKTARGAATKERFAGPTRRIATRSLTAKKALIELGSEGQGGGDVASQLAGSLSKLWRLTLTNVGWRMGQHPKVKVFQYY
ncbi:hypothetical protein C7212DRAFT_337839 [Tuber magnatum]|uniref:Uncharacterized protein n=1 Tax=Tuber magnatum TaxID=42249 RepID=A0A317SBU5_9PEZI|nr:hypothetical protein C7212DRAFT_337839 [Tuber magnatum]